VTKKRNIGKLAQIPVIVSAETKIPTGTKVYGMEVVGMKRNLKTWKKERAVYSWNNALSPCNVDPYAIISGSKTCKDLANKKKSAIEKKCKEKEKYRNTCPDTCDLKCGDQKRSLLK